MPGYYVSNRLVSLFNRNKGICSICDLFIPIQEATIEHNIPKVKGGTDGMHNLSVSHSSCNNERGNEDIDVFRARARTSIAHKRNDDGALVREMVEPNIHLMDIGVKGPRGEENPPGSKAAKKKDLALSKGKWTCIYCASKQVDMGIRQVDLGEKIRVIRHCFNCSQDNIIVTKDKKKSLHERFYGEQRIVPAYNYNPVTKKYEREIENND